MKRIWIFFISFISISGHLSAIALSEPKEPSYHQNDIKNIDDAWSFITSGDEHFKAGDYELALNAYKRAYAINTGSNAVSGMSIAITYEKMQAYDKGIEFIDQLIARGVLSKKGIENAYEIKRRLLASRLDRTRSQTLKKGQVSRLPKALNE